MHDGACDQGLHVFVLCRALVAFNKHAARVKRTLDIDREAACALGPQSSHALAMVLLRGLPKVLDAFAKQVASALQTFTGVNRDLAVVSPRRDAAQRCASCFDAGRCGSDP